ncbi:MAG: VWA domain-containing protein, partial [bacterium]
QTTRRLPPEEIQHERDRVLQQDLAVAESLPAPEAERELEDLLAEAGEPADVRLEPSEAPQGLAAGGAIGPPEVITSEAGERELGRSADGLLRDAVTDRVTIQRPALLSGAAYRESRIVDTLPPDMTEMAMDSPSMVVEAPSLAIPMPDSSLQPSSVGITVPEGILKERPLDLTSVSPGALPAEEQAKNAMLDKYVRLDDLMDVEIVTYREKPGQGYFLLKIRPKAESDRLRPLPKDVIFVLDASASMGRRTLEIIKEMIKESLREMSEADRFNVVGFKSRVEMLSEGMQKASPLAIAESWSFIDTLTASGKTDIYASLEPLMTMGTERARPFLLFLYSDGRPTLGVKDSRAIINRLSEQRGPSTSVYAVGAGDRVNQYLLDFLAFRNRGAICFVESRGDVQQEGLAFFRALRNPLLLRVNADFGTVDGSQVYPQELPDLYQNAELQIWGRFSNEKDLTVRLVGEAFDEQKEMLVRLEIPEQDSGGPDIAKGWALHKIYDLISTIVQHGEQPNILSEINRLSRQYGIVTPYHEQFQE